MPISQQKSVYLQILTIKANLKSSDGMILNIENLGIVKQAKIDMNKKFTLFCGRNNTGKTYVSYVLQAFLSQEAVYPLESSKRIAEQLIKTGAFRLERSFVTEFLDTQCKYVMGQIGTIFGISDSTGEKLFGKLAVSVDYSDKDYEDTLAMEMKATLKAGSIQLSISKSPGSDEVKIEGNEDLSSFLRRGIGGDVLLCRVLHHLAFRGTGDVRMLTVERNSIYTFKTELSLSRNELIDRLQQQSDKPEIDLLDMVNTQSRRYPLAVRSSLRIANDLENIQKYSSPFSEVADMIEGDLLHGEVNVTKNGDVEFHSQYMTRAKKLPFHLSSSIVKTMASLVIYLRHLARPGDTLIIDEPEMNFHPDVQVVLAHLFAILANKGLRVVMSTHSDYVVRELNNLIMAGALQNEGKNELVEKLEYTKDMLLDFHDVEVLFFGLTRLKVIAKSVEIDRLGFAISSIDDTITKQNEASERLYAELVYTE